MPNFTNITILDGKSTPVSHVFKTLRNPAGSAQWAEDSATGSLTKRNGLEIIQKLPSKGRSTVLNEAQLVLPYVVTETINGVPVDVIRSNVRVVCQVICDPDTPKQLRTDARVMMRNLLGDTSVADAFDNASSFN